MIAARREVNYRGCHHLTAIRAGRERYAYFPLVTAVRGPPISTEKSEFAARSYGARRAAVVKFSEQGAAQKASHRASQRRLPDSIRSG